MWTYLYGKGESEEMDWFSFSAPSAYHMEWLSENRAGLTYVVGDVDLDPTKKITGDIVYILAGVDFSFFDIDLDRLGASGTSRRSPFSPFSRTRLFLQIPTGLRTPHDLRGADGAGMSDDWALLRVARMIGLFPFPGNLATASRP